MNDIWKQIVATAVSLTVAGNTGISSFLTLLLVGCFEAYNPDLLRMNHTMHAALASWPALAGLSLGTLLEFIAMCAPSVDEFSNTALSLVIPFLATLGVFGTLGLHDDLLPDNDGDMEGTQRRLFASSTANILFIVFLVVFGIILAWSLHLFRMLMRQTGKQGWGLALLETIWTVFAITMAVFVKPFAVASALILMGAAIWNWKYRCTHQEELANNEAPKRRWGFFSRKKKQGQVKGNQTLSEAIKERDSIKSSSSFQKPKKKKSRGWCLSLPTCTSKDRAQDAVDENQGCSYYPIV